MRCYSESLQFDPSSQVVAFCKVLDIYVTVELVCSQILLDYFVLFLDLSVSYTYVGLELAVLFR